MSKNKVPIVLGLVGIGLITLVGGGMYFRTTAKEWVRDSQAYDKADEEESREKQARLVQQVERYDPAYADEEGLFGSSSSDDDKEKISDLFLMNENDRDSFTEKGGTRKNQRAKKNNSKRKRREKIRHTNKHKKRNRTKRHTKK